MRGFLWITPCNGTGVCGKCKVRIVDGERCRKYLRQNRNYSAEKELGGGYPSGMYDMMFPDDIQVELVAEGTEA